MAVSEARKLGCNASQLVDVFRQIYLATNMGSNASRPFHNWLFEDDNETTDYCSLSGVVCDDSCRVVVLELEDTGLTGTLPDAISLLKYLQRLRLHNNSIGGTIPQSLLQLPYLSNVNLGHNFFIGPFPDLSGLTSLNRIVLHSNLLTGTIPSSLCSLTALKALDFADNEIRGVIPECFADLMSLSTLRIANTNLQGTIPSALCSVRDMNSFLPNPYGCEAIACPRGTFQSSAGRRTSFEPCAECEVESNALGSSTCRVIETSQPTTATTTNFPIAAPTATPRTRIPTSSAQSRSPQDSSFTRVPTVPPQHFVTAVPGASPTNRTQPTGTATGVESSSVEGQGNEAIRSFFIAGGALAVFAILAAVAFFAWTRRHGESDEAVSIDEEALRQDKQVPEQALPRERVHVVNQGADPLDAELERIESASHSTPSTLAIPVSTRMASILKTDTAKYSTNDQLEETRRVRFNIPPVPPVSLANSLSTLGDVSTESSRKKLEATADPSAGSRPWMTWIKPIMDPIQACSTGECRGYSRQNDIDANDIDAVSASSFDSSITSLSQLLGGYPSKSDSLTPSLDPTKMSKWRKTPPSATSLPPSPPSPGPESVLGIRKRSVVNDEERMSALMVCGTDTTLRRKERDFSPIVRRHKQDEVAQPVIKGGYVEEAMSRRISIAPDIVEL